MPSIAALGSIFFLLLATSLPNTASAQTEDHLKCYKVKDPLILRTPKLPAAKEWLKLTGSQFGEENCRIVGGFRLFCVPVTKEINTNPRRKFRGVREPPEPFTPVPFPGRTEQDRICYKIKCEEKLPSPPNPSQEVTDQFESRTVTNLKPFLVCGPAGKGPEFCGDGVINGSEMCEFTDDSACPGFCEADCSCGCPQCPTPTAFPATGQTTSVVAGDDGDIQAGATLSYVDNGDGTITDLNTGLMWEKKVELDTTTNASNLHDADNCYPWGGLCTFSTTLCGTDADCPATACEAADCQNAKPNGLTIFEWVAQLNNVAFAGHTDWRVPNYKELVSILDLEQSTPAVSSAFDGASCGGSCTDLTNPACSCTVPDFYWSSTTVPPGPSLSWLVDFDDGDLFPAVKGFNGFLVRAVRGGL